MKVQMQQSELASLTGIELGCCCIRCIDEGFSTLYAQIRAQAVETF